jgi:hypothetical protein
MVTMASRGVGFLVHPARTIHAEEDVINDCTEGSTHGGTCEIPLGGKGTCREAIPRV